MGEKFAGVIGILKNIEEYFSKEELSDAYLTAVNASYPHINKHDLEFQMASLLRKIEDNKELLVSYASGVAVYEERLKWVMDNYVPKIIANGSSPIFAYWATISEFEKSLDSWIAQGLSAIKDKAKISADLKRIGKQVRSMEALLAGLEPRSGGLKEKIERIEHAHDAADQLPTDLESLADARARIESLVNGAVKDIGVLGNSRDAAVEIDSELSRIKTNAEAVLGRCETAYASATSQGLAAAFSERSNALNGSIKGWVFGLVAALSIGSYTGSMQINKLSAALAAQQTSLEVILVNVFLSALSIGAPVWFAWIATKQIGDRFKLSEDYAFKASISRAYEGYRREAARLDPDLEISLLASALGRLDELPLRLVEAKTHGSPFQELLSSEPIKAALKSVPGFVGTVTSAANNALEGMARPRSDRHKRSEPLPARENNSETEA
jgi:hypothetical protein